MGEKNNLQSRLDDHIPPQKENPYKEKPCRLLITQKMKKKEKLMQTIEIIKQWFFYFLFLKKRNSAKSNGNAIEKENLGCHESWVTRVGSKVAEEAPLLSLSTDPSLQCKQRSDKMIQRKYKHAYVERERDTFSSPQSILGRDFWNRRDEGKCKGNKEKEWAKIENPWKNLGFCQGLKCTELERREGRLVLWWRKIRKRWVCCFAINSLKCQMTVWLANGEVSAWGFRLELSLGSTRDKWRGAHWISSVLLVILVLSMVALASSQHHCYYFLEAS